MSVVVDVSIAMSEALTPVKLAKLLWYPAVLKAAMSPETCTS